MGGGALQGQRANRKGPGNEWKQDAWWERQQTSNKESLKKLGLPWLPYFSILSRFCLNLTFHDSQGDLWENVDKWASAHSRARNVTRQLLRPAAALNHDVPIVSVNGLAKRLDLFFSMCCQTLTMLENGSVESESGGPWPARVWLHSKLSFIPFEAVVSHW